MSNWQVAYSADTLNRGKYPNGQTYDENLSFWYWDAQAVYLGLYSEMFQSVDTGYNTHDPCTRVKAVMDDHPSTLTLNSRNGQSTGTEVGE